MQERGSGVMWESNKCLNVMSLRGSDTETEKKFCIHACIHETVFLNSHPARSSATYNNYAPPITTKNTLNFVQVCSKAPKESTT